MKLCPETLKVQDYLDGELAAAEVARFEAHLAGCRECEAEVAAYRVVFSELRSVPLLDPRPELFERIMDQVLPHRMPRWVKVLGWAYGGAFAASLGAIASAFVLPGPSTWLHGVIAAGLRSLTSTGSFVLRTLSDGLARTGEAFLGGGSAGRLLRLLGSALANPAILLTVIAALGVCAALLWWMRPSERRGTGEIPHVGMLGL
jgi:predicted anti-sigma-YlaC factor YlaD